jgi:hypothetical protein
VLPPINEPPPSCRNHTKTVIPLTFPLEVRIAQDEGFYPSGANIAVASPPGPGSTDVWRWTFEVDPTLSPDETVVILINDTEKPKAITTGACSSNPKEIRVDRKGTGEVRLSRAEDRTLYFQKCPRRGTSAECANETWTDAAILAEQAFWPVFGGRRMTFRYFWEK